MMMSIFTKAEVKNSSTPKKISNITKESSSQKSNNQETIIRPCILVFDSLPGCSPSRIVATLRDYLSVEYEAKKNKKKVFDKESMKAACPKVPKQDNFSDCGLYTLQYAESFFQCPLKDFSLPVGSLQYWFKDEIIKCKRQVIANLIKTLTMQFNPNEEIQLPKLYFATPKNLKKQKEKHEKSSQFGKMELREKSLNFHMTKNRTLSLFDDFVRYPNQCSLRSAVKKKEVDEGISHEAKKLKLESNGENSIEDSNFQSIFSPIDTSDDNDSGHHSDIDNSKDSLNKAFSEEEPSSMDIGFNSENTFHKLKNTLESNDLSSKSELVTKNNLESNDLFSETEITSQNNSLSLVPNEIKRYGKSYERVKKLSLASRKVTPNNVCSELACVKNINDR
ncbi:hypothetical protein Avbf_01240 [Armadillidium vulgare]|nr:hypothetical protein Avbf_01240 [Armadillidium vulgare]